MKFKLNKVVKYLILSDLAAFTGWGLVTPIFAIFIIDRIIGGNAFVAGIASAIYLIIAALLRIPIGMYLDKNKGEIDDFWFMVIGLFIVSFVPFGFIFSTLPWHIYGLQAIHAIGISMSSAGWAAIFTRHIDKGKESTQWGVETTAIGLGGGIAGAVGGWAVIRFGFNPVFIVVGILGIIGTTLLLVVKDKMFIAKDHGISYRLKTKINNAGHR